VAGLGVALGAGENICPTVVRIDALSAFRQRFGATPLVWRSCPLLAESGHKE